MTDPQRTTRLAGSTRDQRARHEAELLSTAHPDQTREHYLPIAVSDLIAELTARLPGTDRDQWRSFSRVLQALVHHEYHQRLIKLMEAYRAFDPDEELPPREALSPEECAAALERLFRICRGLLLKANFEQLDQQDIDEALSAASEWGVRLHVDTSSFERLAVFARGDTMTHRARCNWRTWFRTQQVEVPIYQRLVVMFRLKPEAPLAQLLSEHARPRTSAQQPVFVKLFKDVPKMDVDMLLPGTGIRMTWFDHGRILLPTVSGLAIAGLKIAKGAVIFAFAGVYGLLAFLGFVVGTLGYGLKSFFGYLQTKDKYHLHLTRSLYYQNLDNNAGVFARLVYEAEQQELREALVAYVFLRQHQGEAGLSAADLDRLAEDWLEARLAMKVDFEVEDALEKLARWKLLERLPGGMLRAVPADEACRRLDAIWDGWYNAPSSAPPPHTSTSATAFASPTVDHHA
jgi:hypothetical protein